MSNTNYNKMFDNETTEEVVETVEQVEHFDEVVEEVAEMTEVEPEPENIQLGKVVGCAQLNVRTEPSLFADLATDRPLKRNAEMMVYPDESTDEFYKICTESGVEGFCMKKFIEIQ